jgi:hypothetical protein
MSHRFCRGISMVGKIFVEEVKLEIGLKIQVDVTFSRDQ